MPEVSTQLLRGTLDILILRTLTQGEMHGYEVVRAIDGRTDGVFFIEDGALYQSLHRLEDRGMVESSWGHADSGKRAKYYRLTAAGRKHEKVESAGWKRYAEAVFKVLNPAPAEQ